MGSEIRHLNYREELALVGQELFRAIWIDETVVEGLEIRPLGPDSIGFDEVEEMRTGIISLKLGSYLIKVPRTASEA
ncbi:hypothetical protein [Roseobacter sp.]|uniref:hypothetical protein n=1 Tax=Roseobacter sp. TaxID=1907202 RepID=UPI002966985D|nr:hypothetical protein [Roseobacter sp.]MDW3183364.1 hypothetical protein [Roseobacter sp.]